MSHLLTRMQEQLLATRLPLDAQTDGFQSEPIALNDHRNQEEFSLECLLRVVKVRGKAELLSCVNYYFPEEITVSSKEALSCASQLNDLLMHSRVCVVQDIDGDRRYCLRMDTLLEGAYDAGNLASFLEKVTSDVAILLEYFSEYLSQLSSARSAVGTSFNSSYGASSRMFFRQTLY